MTKKKSAGWDLPITTFWHFRRSRVGKQASSWARSRPGSTRLTGSRDDVGAGTKEIRIKDASGIYRVMYVAKFEDAIYVLHCFQKKTQATSKLDKAIAAARYRAAVNARKARK